MVIKFNSKIKEYKWLSNFYESHFYTKNRWNVEVKYKTVEHYYQSWKADNKSREKKIRIASTPACVRALGKKCKLHEDFDSEKINIMKTGLIEKFTQNTSLLHDLIKTNDHELIHLSPWDKFWGVDGTGNGLNVLGKLLMMIREIIVKGKLEKEYDFVKFKDSEIVKLVLLGLKEKCKTCGGSCFNGYEYCDTYYEKES